MFSYIEHIPCVSRDLVFEEYNCTEYSHWSEQSSHKLPLAMALCVCVCVRLIHGIKKPRHFQVHNGLMYPTLHNPYPKSSFPLSPPVKTACVISWIADNASCANAALFVQLLWPKCTRKAYVLCRHYRSETCYTSLKTDQLPWKSIWASCSGATPCTATRAS